MQTIHPCVKSQLLLLRTPANLRKSPSKRKILKSDGTKYSRVDKVNFVEDSL